MANASTSSSSSRPTTPKRARNFSRLIRSDSQTSDETVNPSHPPPRSIKSLEAFHQPQSTQPQQQQQGKAQPYPNEPRFSHASSASVDSSQDARRNGLVSTPLTSNFVSKRSSTGTSGVDPWRTSQQQRQQQQQQQQQQSHRYPGFSHTQSGTSAATITTKVSASSNAASASEAAMRQLHNSLPKSILKKTEVEQYSERADDDDNDSAGGNRDRDGGSSLLGGEDGRSHHTVSQKGSFDSGGKWTSSEFDIGGLTEKELKRCERKGINPSLFAEMKDARKGKRGLVGGLTGNAYVS